MRWFSVDAASTGSAIMGLPPPRQGALVSKVSSIACPTDAAKAAFAERQRGAGSDREEADLAVERAFRKYSERSVGSAERPGFGCEVPSAEWKMDLAPFHKCIMIVVLEKLQLPPGASVLDWGAGCGHKLTWAAQLYGLDGLGIDIVGESIRWAQEHAIGHFCEVDGRFLEWLPDDRFDGVISYAALMHLQPDDQCAVVTELVGKVRVGGKLWFGWNDAGIYQNQTELQALLDDEERNTKHDVWHRCFSEASKQHPRWASGEIAVIWETVEEALLFPDDMNAIGIYLYYPPAYSLFVTRVPSGTGALHMV